MNLKKIFALMTAVVLTAAIFTGCGEEKKAEAPSNDFKIGMLRHMNASEKDFNGLLKTVSDTFGLKMSTYDPVFFDNLGSMQMALESGKINAFSTYKCVADYIVANNPNMEIADDDTLEFIDAFCLALRSDDKELIEMSNKAVREMRDDGTLDKFIKDYITAAKNEEKIPAIEIKNIPNAKTVKVAVTGDLPPLDYVDSEGNAAGFNTAVLSELSRRIGRNIELVQVDSGARAAALTSGRVDISFWAIVPVSEIIPQNADRPDGVELTTPYYRGKIVHVKMKK
ncbi:MAG: transporter substrate-binding domain-containing protein [Selenomonadaceae bacterium]|nr:transporter substrate-binding domain-containing protein [Selenomonadaceae bacterium]